MAFVFLEAFAAAAQAAFGAAASADALEAARVEYLGAKSGRLKDVQKQLGGVAKEDKPAAGKAFNDAKNTVEAAFNAAKERLSAGAEVSSREPFDRTLPGKRSPLGHLHPISQTIDELKDLMGRLGFTVAVGGVSGTKAAFGGTRTMCEQPGQGIFSPMCDSSHLMCCPQDGHVNLTSLIIRLMD